MAPVLALLWLSTGCACTDAPPAPRLVLLYAPCTVAKGYLSPYAPDVTYTPHLEAFAARARTFERHQTEAGQSGIAYASLFTGSQADHHGVWRHPMRLSDDLLLVFEAFAEAGYEPFYWNAHPMASARLNYAQGVPEENRFRENLVGDHPRFRQLLERLASDPDARALVVTNFSVTHGPYPPARLTGFRQSHPELFSDVRPGDAARYLKLYREHEFELSWNHRETVKRLGLGTEEIASLARVLELTYASNVAYLDELFGEVVARIEEAGLVDESLVAFTADHGELLYRETAPFQWSHSMQLAPEVLGVPLLVLGPGVEQGRYDGVTRSIDLLPTLLGLAGVALPPGSGVQGVDLAAALRGAEPEPRLEAPSHTTTVARSVFAQMHSAEHADSWAHAARFFPTPEVEHVWVGLRREDELATWRSLDGEQWGFEVFDLRGSPRHPDRVHAGPETLDETSAGTLRGYKKRLVDAYRGSRADRGARQLIEKEEAQALRELGYIR